VSNHVWRHKQTEDKRTAIVILISLKREAENKSSEELKTEILKALEESLMRIPLLVLEDFIVVQG
jgi:hypothetical protein